MRCNYLPDQAKPKKNGRGIYKDGQVDVVQCVHRTAEDIPYCFPSSQKLPSSRLFLNLRHAFPEAGRLGLSSTHLLRNHNPTTSLKWPSSPLPPRQPVLQPNLGRKHRRQINWTATPNNCLGARCLLCRPRLSHNSNTHPPILPEARLRRDHRTQTRPFLRTRLELLTGPPLSRTQFKHCLLNRPLLLQPLLKYRRNHQKSRGCPENRLREWDDYAGCIEKPRRYCRLDHGCGLVVECSDWGVQYLVTRARDGTATQYRRSELGYQRSSGSIQRCRYGLHLLR